MVNERITYVSESLSKFRQLQFNKTLVMEDDDSIEWCALQ